MFVRRLAALVAALALGSVILWGAAYVVLVRELLDGGAAPPTSELAQTLRLAEPWSFVDEALARPCVTAALGPDPKIVHFAEVQATPGRLELRAWLAGTDRFGFRAEGTLRIVAEHYTGYTVDDTAWGWQYPVVELWVSPTEHRSFTPPARLVTDDPERPRRW